MQPFFSEDAVYEGDGVNNFDRRMDSRTPKFQTPTVSGNTLTMNWSVHYTKKGLPDLVIAGVETATFRGDRITRLRDDFTPAAQQAMAGWMAQHGSALNG